MCIHFTFSDNQQVSLCEISEYYSCVPDNVSRLCQCIIFGSQQRAWLTSYTLYLIIC